MNTENKNPKLSECIEYITLKSHEFNIPVRLSLATAWIESHFVQFNPDGSVLCNPSGNDFGIMQINIGLKAGVTNWGFINNNDWERLLVDWKFNIDVGLSELQSCYVLASSSEEIENGFAHFRVLTAEECIARAAYSAYNGGPQNLTRYRTQLSKPIDYKINPYVNSDGYDIRDINFWNIYYLKLWEKS